MSGAALSLVPSQGSRDFPNKDRRSVSRACISLSFKGQPKCLLLYTVLGEISRQIPGSCQESDPLGLDPSFPHVNSDEPGQELPLQLRCLLPGVLGGGLLGGGQNPVGAAPPPCRGWAVWQGGRTYTQEKMLHSVRDCANMRDHHVLTCVTLICCRKLIYFLRKVV